MAVVLFRNIAIDWAVKKIIYLVEICCKSKVLNFLELHSSACCQPVLKNVDTVEHLCLECNQDQYMQSQWKQDEPEDWSDVCQEKLSRKKILFQKFLNQQWTNGINKVQSTKKSTEIGELNFLFWKKRILFEVRRNIIPKKFFFLLDTFLFTASKFGFESSVWRSCEDIRRKFTSRVNFFWLIAVQWSCET